MTHLALHSSDAPSQASEPPVLEALLTAPQVARIVGVPPKRVYELGIPAVRISERSLRWRPAAVAEWIASHEERR